VLTIDPWCRRRMKLVARAFCFRPTQPFGLTAAGSTDTIRSLSLGQPLVSRWGMSGQRRFEDIGGVDAKR